MTDLRPGTLEFWARERPDAPAIIEGDRVLTWSAWNDLADRLAEGLAARGLVAGNILVTRMQIRPEWAIASAAAAKLGLRLLGLNWHLTPAETKFVLSNSGAHAIICDDREPAGLTPAFEGLPLKFAASVDVTAKGFLDWSSLLERAPRDPRVAVTNPRLILYTSGTTGLPKGVVMGGPEGRTSPEQQKQVFEYQMSVAGRSSGGASSADVVFVTLPMHHGAGPATIWGATATGSLMVLLRRFDPEEALRLIAKHRITRWTGVPTMYKRIAGLPADVIGKYDVSSLKGIGIGAAPASHALKEWIVSRFGDILSEGYGTTEAGMITFLPAGMQSKKPGSCGKPHTHVYLSIRNEDGVEVPTGQEGEIWVKTPVVIRNYLNAATLGPDTLDDQGFMRSGDVGRLDDEGFLYITDRAKDMIVAGGVNIYPAEIEAAILTHPAVQDVAVVGVPDDDFGEVPKAFCELKPGRSADAADILEHCKATLASYKRPKTIDFVSELPRNTMGKLLKRELRDPFWKGRERKV